MEKTIKLYSYYGLYQDKSILYKLDEDLRITIDVDIPRSTTLFYTIGNGLSKLQGEIKDKQIIIPNEFIKVGKLSISIELNQDGETLRRFRVEDLLIRELDKGIEIIPELENFRIKLNETERKVDALENRLSLFELLWKEGI